ncbi:MAG: hypothetical protein ACTSPY_03095 [Candidatus Helarchaeota archaeon]
MIDAGWPAVIVNAITLANPWNLDGISWRWAVIGPLYLLAVIVLAIAIWIGITMISTPPPVPLDELEEMGLEDEEEAEEKSD